MQLAAGYNFRRLLAWLALLLAAFLATLIAPTDQKSLRLYVSMFFAVD
jgi:hypothetical protein